ncbi:TrmB family transcriptional regulator [Candidatus Micrarchaeota archaeon]|nr:TrmB family transcriptional regulator [Candidatus Micrarchaeota archaeon]
MKLVNGDALALLRRIGLNQYESRVYLALLGGGPTSASELSDLAGIPRPRTYDVLDKLGKKGFVSTQPGRPSKFRALTVSEAFSSLKEFRQRDFQKELSEMDKIRTQLTEHVRLLDTSQQQADSGDFVWVLRDSENIHAKIESLIQNAHSSILIASSPAGLKRKLAAYEDTLLSAKKRGVKISIISPLADDLLEKRARHVGEVVKKSDLHRMMIVDDHVMLFLTPEEEKQEIGAWIQSPYVAQNFKNLLL